MSYPLIHFQDLFTVEWLTALGTIFTGSAAAYAAMKAVQLAKLEHLRIVRADTVAAKAFCYRSINEVYHTANNLKLGGLGMLTELATKREAPPAFDDLVSHIRTDPIPTLRVGFETLLLLPDPLPSDLSRQMASLDNLINNCFQLLQQFSGPEKGSDSWYQFAQTIAERARDLGIEMGKSARAMEKFIGSKLLPEES